MVHDALVGAGAMVLTGVTLQSGTAVSRLTPGPEVARKILHALCGLIVLVTLVMVHGLAVFLVVVGLTAGILVITVHTRAFPVILYGDKRRDYGLVCFAVGLFVTSASWWDHKPSIVAGVLTLGFADAAAAVAGQRFGKRPIITSGATRSVEGTLTFAAVCFVAVTGALTVGAGASVATALGVAALVAVTTAAIEAVVPSAADNLLIIPWVTGLTVLGVRLAEPWSWFGIAGFAVAMMVLFARLRWLDLPGALAAGLVAGGVVALASWAWLAPLAAFFALSSLLGAAPGEQRSDRALRGLPQVVVNGALLSLVPALGWAMFHGSAWFAVSVAGIAAATGDTWASEIGRRNRRAPVSLRSFTRVAPGSSGAVSLLGTAASGVGGLMIGVVATAVSDHQFMVMGLLAGLFGSLADSLAGAVWQGHFTCVRCGAQVEDRRHCAVRGQLRSGVAWVDNEVVNAIANATGMAVAGVTIYIA